MRVWVGGRCGSGCGGGMGWEAGGWVGGGDLGGVRPAAIHHQARTQYTFRTSLAKRGENSRFAKAMRSEGDESGIAYWKRKERVIFKEEMFSMGAILMKLAVFLKENVSRVGPFFKNRHFLFENQSFLDFQRGHATLITFGPHCPSETRVFTAFR